MCILTRPEPGNALLVVLLAMVSPGCAYQEASGDMAHVRVVTSGVTTESNAVEFLLDAAAYDFVATGTADADSATITLTVREHLGAEVATVDLSLSLAEANASPGDTGSGATAGVVVQPGAQTVTVEFRWQGHTPPAELVLDMSFFDNPDIVEWTAQPAPPVEAAALVHVEVDAKNNEGPPAEMTVSAQYRDADDGSVIDAVTLTLDGDGLFKGDIHAPNYPGDHGLRIVATDNTGGVTQHERIHSVR